MFAQYETHNINKNFLKNNFENSFSNDKNRVKS